MRDKRVNTWTAVKGIFTTATYESIIGTVADEHIITGTTSNVLDIDHTAHVRGHAG